MPSIGNKVEEILESALVMLAPGIAWTTVRTIYKIQTRFHSVSHLNFRSVHLSTLSESDLLQEEVCIVVLLTAS